MVDKATMKLNLKQEKFCQLYTSQDREMFGNGVESYIEAYEPDKSNENWYNGAKASASRLLSSVNVIERINELLEEGGFLDQNIDKQHLFLINQHADLKTKLGAIKEYNALKKRIGNKLELILPKPLLDVLHNHSNKETSEDGEED